MDSAANKILSTDLLIIGSEGAGARAAIEAVDRHKGLSVTVVTKGYLGRSGATVTAGSDFSIDSRSAKEMFGLPGDCRDSPEAFFEDMIRAGRYLNNQRLAEIHVCEAPLALKDLVDWGIRIGGFVIHPGHSYPRGVMIPGTEYPRVLGKELRKRKINVIEHMMVTDLIVHNRKAIGVVGLRMSHGEFWVLKAKAIVIATGGGMRIYPFITAAEELTGDGLAFAFRAGVGLINTEFPQFLPYCLKHPQAASGTGFSYVLGIYLRPHALNRHGERYMEKWDPRRLEFSTRDLNSIGAMVEILEGRGSPHGGTYLSLKHLPDNLIEYSAKWFPAQSANWKSAGFYMKDILPDLGREAIETAPACHFFNGGINTNEKCETNIEGLYAAGEAAGNLHGADRISGNAMTETQVWGKRAGKFAADYAVQASLEEPDPDEVERLRDRVFRPFSILNGIRAITVKKEIQQLAGTYVGVVKNKAGLEKAIDRINQIKKDLLPVIGVGSQDKIFNHDWVEALQVENMLTILEIIARTSLLREESRGCHYRTDYPQTDNKIWVKNILVEDIARNIQLSVTPAILTKSRPEEEIIPYASAGPKT